MRQEVRQEVRRLSDPASLALYEQQRKLEDNKSLLEEVKTNYLFIYNCVFLFFLI